MSSSGQVLRWRRYKRAKILPAWLRRNGSARFTIKGRVMMSGWAPDAEFNNLICRLFNALHSVASIARKKQRRMS